MTRDELLGKHYLPNGWTVSIIGHGYGASEGLLEAWAWDADGHAPEDPEGWLTEEEAQAYLDRIAAL